MSEELISKKEILDEMNISYGQLYRWKRKKLIPEEWFIKKSVSTGQETFFPREKIIERINLILESKDDISLDELADKLTLNIKDITLTKEFLISSNLTSSIVIEKLEEIITPSKIYDEKRLFILFIYDNLLNKGTLSLNEVNEIITSLFNNYEKLDKETSSLIVKRKLGVCFYYVLLGSEDILDDKSATILIKIPFKDILAKISRLK